MDYSILKTAIEFYKIIFSFYYSMIPIYRPYLANYKKSALKAIEDEWISNHGIYIDLAGDKLKTILNIKYCVLMNNGTSATHCLFKALKYKYPQVKKIYVPNNVFIAPWNCGLMEYDLATFEVMKLNPVTMNIDTSAEYIQTLEQGSAVLIVHNLGNIVNVPRLHCLRPDLIFIEDNCEGLFGKYENRYSGSSDATLCSSISFYGNKTITTGEGGAFLTNDLEIYKYIKTYFSHGMSDIRYLHNIQGTNYRMTNIQAGFLYDQLNDINHILDLKKIVFERYRNLFKDMVTDGIVMLLEEEKGTEMANWMFVVIIPSIQYGNLEKYLLEKLVQVRPFFYDVHAHAHLRDIKEHKEISLDAHTFSKNITNHGVMLPSYPELSADEQQYIVQCINEYLATETSDLPV